jgi:hypothetical protein
VLIDGEHTNTAVFRDFLSTLRFIKPSAIIAFHDANIVFDGLQNIEQFLLHQKIAFRSFYLPDCVFAIGLGDFVHLAEQPLQRAARDRNRFLADARASLWKEVGANAALIEGCAIGHRGGL